MQADRTFFIKDGMDATIPSFTERRRPLMRVVGGAYASDRPLPLVDYGRPTYVCTPSTYANCKPCIWAVDQITREAKGSEFAMRKKATSWCGVVGPR